jgi:hypothetical protein
MKTDKGIIRTIESIMFEKRKLPANFRPNKIQTLLIEQHKKDSTKHQVNKTSSIVGQDRGQI